MTILFSATTAAAFGLFLSEIAKDKLDKTTTYLSFLAFTLMIYPGFTLTAPKDPKILQNMGLAMYFYFFATIILFAAIAVKAGRKDKTLGLITFFLPLFVAFVASIQISKTKVKKQPTSTLPPKSEESHQ